MNPKVSVIMPIYNAENYVQDTIQCILGQTFSDFELLLINDWPTDSTLDIIREIKDKRIRIINNDKNRGIAFSRNHGLEEAKGEYIALMDDDDLSPLNRLQIEVEYLDSHPEIDVVGGSYVLMGEDNNYSLKNPTPVLNNPLYIRAQLMFYCTMYNGSTMYRKNMIDKYAIKYMDNLLGMEDYRFWIECSLYAKMTNINEVFLYWRQVKTTETMKVLSEKRAEREKTFASIQRYALQANGFKLTEEELKIFTDAFKELDRTPADWNELTQIYNVLKKIVNQAKYFGYENAKEVLIACRKNFTQIFEASNIWV